MILHVVGGWAYATNYLDPLAAALKPHVDVVPHPFHVELTELTGTINDTWMAGWSLGGLRLLDAAARGEISPRGIILISSTARFCADNKYLHGVTTAALRSMMIGIKRQRDKTLFRFFSDSLGNSTHDAEINERIQMAGMHENEVLLAGLHQLEVMDVRESLRSIRIPMLIVHGKRDAIIPPEASMFIQSNVTSSSLHIQQDAGHELPVSNPGWVADRMVEFIGEG